MSENTTYTTFVRTTQGRVPYKVGELAKAVVQRITDCNCMLFEPLESEVYEEVDPEHIMTSEHGEYYVCCQTWGGEGAPRPIRTVLELKWAMEYGYEVSKDTLIQACKYGKQKVVNFLVHGECPIN